MIRFGDGSFFRFPQTRWTFSHFRQFVPTRAVSRGNAAASELPRAERADIDAIRFQPIGGAEPMTWAQSLSVNYTDGILVLHRGRIVYERYFGVLTPAGQHIAFSVTKSFVATLAAALISEGVLDERATVASYVPELKESGFGDATIRQLLDMTTGLKYSENYVDANSPVWEFCRANGFLPRPAGYHGPETSYAYLQTLSKEYPHGERFVYKTVNTDALAWVMSRVTGRPLSELLRERIWSRLGVEQDAYFTVDSGGTEFAGGGLNASLRDLARFGEMMRLGGRYNGRQIVPAAVIDDIRRGGSREQFAPAGYKTLPGWSYRNMWWVSHNSHGAFTARGVHGQAIYIDPKAEMVIARFASHPMAGNVNIDPTSLPAYEALAAHLMSGSR
ncbi:MAG: serine hydrolase [Acidobacteria bacterium]|nr:serine hydrolase [Acidobacteriota bacterium]